MCFSLSHPFSESKDGTKSKGRKGAKNSATAAKVALMKLKLHAAGDKGLPQVYFWDVKTICCGSYYLFIDVHHFWFSSALFFSRKEHIFRSIFPRNPKTPANPCFSVPNGVLAKWWIMQLQ